MTTRSSSSHLTAAVAAALAGLLLLPPVAQARMWVEDATITTADASAKAGESTGHGYGQPPVVRDHRKHPEPYAFPRHGRPHRPLPPRPRTGDPSTGPT